jgi:hypothetical protein
MRTHAPRRLSLVAALLLALASALIALAAAREGPASAAATSHMQHRATITQSQLAFRQDMRKLWEDHITWTRLAIVSFAAGLPDLAATEQRLLRNQADIGDAVAPFYGRKAANRLTGLLRTHILEAVDVLVAAKAGDAAKLAAAQKAWYRNADDIARFLHRANPHQWSFRDLRAMMHEHLHLTTNEAVSRLRGQYAADIRAYDRVHTEILAMADMLSTGVIAQFPDRFRH